MASTGLGAAVFETAEANARLGRRARRRHPRRRDPWECTPRGIACPQHDIIGSRIVIVAIIGVTEVNFIAIIGSKLHIIAIICSKLHIIAIIGSEIDIIATIGPGIVRTAEETAYRTAQGTAEDAARLTALRTAAAASAKSVLLLSEPCCAEKTCYYLLFSQEICYYLLR
jgi:hypothetical protein